MPAPGLVGPAVLLEARVVLEVPDQEVVRVDALVVATGVDNGRDVLVRVEPRSKGLETEVAYEYGHVLRAEIAHAKGTAPVRVDADS